MISKKTRLLSVLLFSAVGIGVLVSTSKPAASYAAKAVVSGSSEVARLSYVKGPTSFLPAGGQKWVKTTVNYPLVTGDRIWAGDNAFLELQMNNGLVRMASQTSVKMLNL